MYWLQRAPDGPLRRSPRKASPGTPPTCTVSTSGIASSCRSSRSAPLVGGVDASPRKTGRTPGALPSCRLAARAVSPAPRATTRSTSSFPGVLGLFSLETLSPGTSADVLFLHGPPLGCDHHRRAPFRTSPSRCTRRWACASQRAAIGRVTSGVDRLFAGDCEGLATCSRTTSRRSSDPGSGAGRGREPRSVGARVSRTKRFIQTVARSCVRSKSPAPPEIVVEPSATASAACSSNRPARRALLRGGRA